MKLKVVHVINWLNFGGAEVMLCNLLGRTDRDRFDPVVVSLIDVLPLAGRIEALGVPVHAMGMRPGVPDPRRIARLAGLLGRERPALIQGWMYHANLIAGLASAASVRAPVVWGIHHSQHDRRSEKRSTLWTVGACARLSRWMPAWIVCCAESSRAAHVRRGFAVDRMSVITNGIDTQSFRPDPAARVEVRRELGLGPEATLIGLAARYSPAKDPLTFLRAAARIGARRPDANFLICGTGMVEANAELASAVDALGLRDRCHLLGARDDMSRIMAALDLLAQSSATEAFPLSLGEAMACGVPCVATDVGDTAAIVGETGLIVPPGDPEALAAGCLDLIDRPAADLARLGAEGRARIRARFELDRIVHSYEELYDSLFEGAPPAGGRRSLAPEHRVAS